MAMINIPPGYHFVPSDQELVTLYLLKACLGLPMPLIRELSYRDLYGVDPWDVLSDVNWDTDDYDHMETSSKSKHVRVTYVLTTLSRGDCKSRAVRRTRTGTWKGQTSGTKIRDESGQLIGIKKMFSFMPDTKEDKEKGRNGESWIMHEYSLDYDDHQNLKNKDLVLCRIKHVYKDLNNINNTKGHQKQSANNNNKRSRSSEEEEQAGIHVEKMQKLITEDPDEDDDDTMSFWKTLADMTSCSSSDLDALGVALPAPQEEITHHQFPDVVPMQYFPKRLGLY